MEKLLAVIAVLLSWIAIIAILRVLCDDEKPIGKWFEKRPLLRSLVIYFGCGGAVALISLLL